MAAQNPFINSLKPPTITTSASSAALLDPTLNKGVPLRKSSSAVGWSLLGAELAKEGGRDAFHQLAERPGAFLECSSRKKPQGSTYALSALSLLGKDEGLVMNVPSSSSSQSDNRSSSGMFAGFTSGHGGSSLVAAATACLHGSSSTSQMGSVVPSTSTANQTPTSTGAASSSRNPLVESAPPADPPSQRDNKHGMLNSVFNRGFLGRPIQRSDEESYRYIMALDR